MEFYLSPELNKFWRIIIFLWYLSQGHGIYISSNWVRPNKGRCSRYIQNFIRYVRCLTSSKQSHTESYTHSIISALLSYGCSNLRRTALFRILFLIFALESRRVSIIKFKINCIVLTHKIVSILHIRSIKMI